MSREIARTRVARWRGSSRTEAADVLVVEEPCEIRLHGEGVAVVMRTPGHDAELAAGFLYTEGIVAAGDFATVSTCTDPDELNAENVVEATLIEGRTPLQGWQRNFYAASSCGICGKASIDSVRQEAPPVPSGPEFSAEVIFRGAELLREGQQVFKTTGGLHAATVITTGGKLQLLREDIGRHNAVDKVVGHAVLTEMSLDQSMLVVSGRTSFEIVQKALMARIPVVAGVSAGSSLAVDLARDGNMTLIGFLRKPEMVVYCGEERLVP